MQSLTDNLDLALLEKVELPKIAFFASSCRKEILTKDASLFEFEKLEIKITDLIKAHFKKILTEDINPLLSTYSINHVIDVSGVGTWKLLINDIQIELCSSNLIEEYPNGININMHMGGKDGLTPFF